MSEARATATADDLAAQGSVTVNASRKINWAQLGQVAALAVQALAFVLANYATAELPAGVSMLLTSQGMVWAILPAQAAFALYTWWKANKIIVNRVWAERRGVHNGEPDPAPSPPVEQPPDTRR